jgi:hypothetical protein
MPSVIDAGWRSARTQYGDTLARIAARELQDAARWPDIAWLNNLLPPYLARDASHPGVVSGRVILVGANIRIPVPGLRKQGVTPVESFGVDARLSHGLMSVAGGDLALASGLENLRQALLTRLRSDTGCLAFHPKYGNAAHKLRGRKSDASARLLALRFCEECVLGDPRVISVQGGLAEQQGDAISVQITAIVDDGSPLRLQIDI